MLSGLLGLFSISFAEEGKWTRKADMPTARWLFSASVVDGKIYVIGGASDFNANQTVQAVEEYDPVTDTWTRKADMPTPRTWLSTSAVNGKIYAIGGRIADRALATVEEYDVVTDKWEKKKEMPTARWALSTAVVDGKIYAIGGWLGWPNKSFSTVEEYDPVRGWTRKADMPTPRFALSASVVNGNIYAIGGWDNNWFLGAVETYNPVTNRWTKKADIPNADGLFYTQTVNGKIYAMYGGSWTVEEYDTGLAIEAKGKLAASWGKLKARD